MKRTNVFGWYILLLTAALTLLPAGCSPVDPPRPEPQDEICLNTDVQKVQQRALLRANTIDNASALQAQDIKIDAYFHGTNTKYLDGAKLHYNSSWMFWDGSAQLHYYWPIEGSVYDPASTSITYTSLDFVGFCPYDKPSYIGSPTYDHSTGVTFTATMPTETLDAVNYMTLASQSSLQEYLVAVLPDQTKTTQAEAGGALPMQLKHPFALIKFVITAASGEHVQIDSICIAGLKTGGTCTYDGTTMSWSSQSGSVNMKLIQVLKRSGTTETTPFMVIPNNYGTKFLKVSATWDDWSDVTIRDYGTDVAFNWEPGHIYTYNLTLDKYGLIVDIAKYTEQW